MSDNSRIMTPQSVKWDNEHSKAYNQGHRDSRKDFVQEVEMALWLTNTHDHYHNLLNRLFAELTECASFMEEEELAKRSHIKQYSGAVLEE